MRTERCWIDLRWRLCRVFDELIYTDTYIPLFFGRGRGCYTSQSKTEDNVFFSIFLLSDVNKTPGTFIAETHVFFVVHGILSPSDAVLGESLSPTLQTKVLQVRVEVVSFL